MSILINHSLYTPKPTGELTSVLSLSLNLNGAKGVVTSPFVFTCYQPVNHD